MRWLTQKSIVLLVLAAVLGVGAFWPDSALDPTRDLPLLPAFPAEEVRRIEITKGQLKKVVIEGDLEAGFRVIQPYQGPADTLGIRPMLRALEAGIVMDLRVDEGSLEDYGVDDQNGILVELFAQDEELPRLSFVVGFNVLGGSSFVRMRDSEIVYRAKVGSRHRYDREVHDWRDRMVLSWDWENITDIEIDVVEGDALHFQRVPEGVRSDGVTLFSDWELVQDRGFGLDQDAVSALARNLSVLRSGAVLSAEYDAGWDPPASTVTLRGAQGAVVTLSFGQESVEGAAFVRLDPLGSVYRVAGGARDVTLQPILWWRDRQVFDIPSSELLSLTLVDVQGRRVLTRSEDGLWIVTEPRNVDTDSKQAGFSVNTLRDLRADVIVSIGLEEAGLSDPSQILTMELSNGDEVELIVGRSFQDQQGRLLHYVKRSDSPIVYGLRDGRGTNSGLSHIRRGFGRAD